LKKRQPGKKPKNRDFSEKSKLALPFAGSSLKQQRNFLFLWPQAGFDQGAFRTENQVDFFLPLGYHNARWGSRCLRKIPQPNTGTGVRFPGEPVAVMAQRFSGRGGNAVPGSGFSFPRPTGKCREGETERAQPPKQPSTA